MRKVIAVIFGIVLFTALALVARDSFAITLVYISTGSGSTTQQGGFHTSTGTVDNFSATSATITRINTSILGTVNYVASVATNASTTGGVAAGNAVAVTIGVNPSSGTLQGNAFNGANQLLQLDSSAGFSVTPATVSRLNVTGAADFGGVRANNVSSATVNSDATRFSQTKLIGYASASISASSASTGVNYASTTLNVTIKPQFTSSKIKLSVSGPVTSAALATSNAYINVYRNSTLVCGTGGCNQLAAGIAASVLAPFSFVAEDSPATTSPIQYTVAIKGDDAITAITFCAANITCRIIAEEINGL